MRLIDILRLARQNLLRAPLRTALTAIGVAIGTAAVVTLIAVGNGSQDMAVRRASSYGSLSTIRVLPFASRAHRDEPTQFHPLTTATLNTIAHIPHVSKVTSSLLLPSLRLTLGGHSAVVQAAGQSPLGDGMTLVASSPGPTTSSSILLPASVVGTLGVSRAALIGHNVTLTAGGSVCCTSATGGEPDTSMVVMGPDRHYAAQVSGIYDDSAFGGTSGKSNSSSAPVLVANSLAAGIDGQLRGMTPARFLESQGYATVIATVDDSRLTEDVAHKIKALSYEVQDRADLLAQMHLAFAILTALLGSVGGIALLVAAVGIANTMIMTILERTREIGIMKALGAEPGTIRRLFLVESTLVGLLGGIAGLLLALLGSAIGNAVFRAWLKGQGASGVIGNLFLIPAALAVGALLLAMLISLIAGALPSQRAVRLQPLEALRYE